MRRGTDLGLRVWLINPATPTNLAALRCSSGSHTSTKIRWYLSYDLQLSVKASKAAMEMARIILIACLFHFIFASSPPEAKYSPVGINK